MNFGHKPKTLAERLAWMAENLPSFKEELEEVNAIEAADLPKSDPPNGLSRPINGGTGILNGGAN